MWEWGDQSPAGSLPQYLPNFTCPQRCHSTEEPCGRFTPGIRPQITSNSILSSSVFCHVSPCRLGVLCVSHENSCQFVQFVAKVFHAPGYPCRAKNAATASLNASGCSTGVAWRESGMTTSSAHGILAT